MEVFHPLEFCGLKEIFMNKIKRVGKRLSDDGVVIEGVPFQIGIPDEDLVLPNPGLLEFYNDVRNRVIYLDQDVESGMTIEAQKLILAWNKEDKDVPVEERKPIKIMLYTYGGEVSAYLQLVDIILLSKTPVWTINLGVAYSAGFDILLAGHKRYCLERSQALFHLGSSSISGTGTQVQDHAKNYEKMMKGFGEWVLSRTKITKELYNRKKKNEWFFDAKEQVEYGIVDAIVTDIDTLLN